jgi:hypothetical protein
MLKALPDIREDGNNVHVDPGWEVTLHAGRGSAPVSIQQVTRVTVENEFLVVETQKNQRIVLILDDVRGFAAEPSSTDRRGRKTGFV